MRKSLLCFMVLAFASAGISDAYAGGKRGKGAGRATQVSNGASRASKVSAPVYNPGSVMVDERGPSNVKFY